MKVWLKMALAETPSMDSVRWVRPNVGVSAALQMFIDEIDASCVYMARFRGCYDG